MPPSIPYASQRVNPVLFFGRSRLDLLNTILDAAVCVRSLAICGGWGMGKTTLLERTEAEIEKRGWIRGEGGLCIVPVRVRMLSRGEEAAGEFLWRCVAETLQRCLPDQELPDDALSLSQRFRQVFANVERPTTILLLLDDADRVLISADGQGFADNLRAMISDEPGVRESLAAVFAGGADLHKLRKDLGSPLANVLRWHSLELLDEADADRLVHDPVDLPRDEAFAHRVWKLSGGHPLIMQFLLEEVRDQRTEARLAEAARIFQSQHGLFRHIWNDQFDRRVRLAYAEIEDHHVSPTPAMMDDLVGIEWTEYVSDRLCHNGVARRRGGRLELVGDLFREWFRSAGREQILPAVEQDVRNLILDRLEPALRTLCNRRLADTEYGNCAGWKQSCLAADQRADPNRLYLGDFFQIMNHQLPLFEKDLRFLGDGERRIRKRLAKRSDALCPVRNQLCHPGEERVKPARLRLAKRIALEMLDRLSHRMGDESDAD